MNIKRLGIATALTFLLQSVVSAQITVPNTLADGDTITAAPLNTNFTTLGNHALDRVTGGNLTGNITADALVTIDGVDVGVQACITCNPTHAKLTLSDTSATSLTVGGGLTIGTGAVALVNTTGKIPAFSSTYFASLDGTNLTGVALLGSNNTFTAREDLLTYTETQTAPTISGGTLTISLTAGTHFLVALNANIGTFTITGAPTTGRAGAFTVAFTADGTLRTITWPASVKWPGGIAPVMTSTSTKVDVISFVTYNGGTTWWGFVAGQAF